MSDFLNVSKYNYLVSQITKFKLQAVDTMEKTGNDKFHLGRYSVCNDLLDIIESFNKIESNL